MHREKDPNEITMFESVGISVEDIVAANLIYEYAKENGMGILLKYDDKCNRPVD